MARKAKELEPVQGIDGALELLERANGKLPGQKYDPRTEVATDSVTGDTYGAVTWQPENSDQKFHYVIIRRANGTMEFLHSPKTGRPVTLKAAKDISKHIAAYRMAGIIQD